MRKRGWCSVTVRACASVIVSTLESSVFLSGGLSRASQSYSPAFLRFLLQGIRPQWPVNFDYLERRCLAPSHGILLKKVTCGWMPARHTSRYIHRTSGTGQPSLRHSGTMSGIATPQFRSIELSSFELHGDPQGQWPILHIRQFLELGKRLGSRRDRKSRIGRQT